MSLIALLLVAKVKAIISNIATLFDGLVNNIASIITQLNCNNDATSEDIFKVLPHNLYVP